MSEYIKLGDLISSISKTHSFDKEKLVFLNTSDVSEGKILINHYSEVSTLKGQAKKAIQNGDILYSEIRPKNKRYAYVKNLQNPEDYVVSTKLMVLRKKSKDIDTDYLYHFLTSESTLNYLQRKAENRIGSFPQITFDVLKIVKIRLPILSDQRKIAAVLSALDDKIELNNKINTELEAMAKTLYDYWFVQFDFPLDSVPFDSAPFDSAPFDSAQGPTSQNAPEADENGAVPEQPLPVADGHAPVAEGSRTVAERSRTVAERSRTVAERSRTVAERSRGYKSSGGKMVYNEVLKREIPEGWEVKNIFDVAKVQYGFPFSTQFFNADEIGVPVIRIRDILENSISNYSSEKNVDEKYVINKGDLLIGMDGNFHINYWSKNGCYLNQRVVMIKEKNIPNMLVRYQIEPYIKLREKSVSRTTVGHLSDKDLKRLNILVPTKTVAEKSKKLFDHFLQKIVTNQNQNQELAQLRDWLLPMLMNGQVTVGEVEEKMGMVAEGPVHYQKT